MVVLNAYDNQKNATKSEIQKNTLLLHSNSKKIRIFAQVYNH